MKNPITTMNLLCAQARPTVSIVLLWQDAWVVCRFPVSPVFAEMKAHFVPVSGGVLSSASSFFAPLGDSHLLRAENPMPDSHDHFL